MHLIYSSNLTSNVFCSKMGRAFNFSELPVKEEGFSKIDQVEIQLICDTPYKVTEKFLLVS